MNKGLTVIFVILVSILSFLTPISQASALSNCVGSYSATLWDNCIGSYVWSSGDKYVGEFQDGKQNGQGTYTGMRGERYEGGWKDGKRHGQGAYTYANGNKYIGEYKDDQMHGQGTLIFTDGSKTVGTWENDEPTGDATRYNAHDSIDQVDYPDLREAISNASDSILYKTVASCERYNDNFSNSGRTPYHVFDFKDGGSLYSFHCETLAHYSNYFLFYRANYVDRFDFKNFRKVELQYPSKILRESDDGIIRPIFTSFDFDSELSFWEPNKSVFDNFDETTSVLTHYDLPWTNTWPSNNYAFSKWKFDPSKASFLLVEYKMRVTNLKETGDPNFELDLSISPAVFRELPTEPVKTQSFCGGKALVPDISSRSIVKARKTLIGFGWEPKIELEGFSDVFWREKKFIDSGIVEISSCSSVGLAFCRFDYENSAAYLFVSTSGEDDFPRVYGYDITCKP